MNWLSLFLILGIILRLTFKGVKVSKQAPVDKTMHSVKGIVSSFLVITLLVVLNPNLCTTLDFSNIDKGHWIEIETFHTVCFSAPLTVFLLAWTRWTNLYPEHIQEEKEMFGYPLSFYPDNYSQLFFFFIALVVGVVFEELLCRQFLFYLLHATLGLQGDWLLLATAFLFSIGHLYQGKGGVLSSFVVGLILGGLFLFDESIFSPILAHLLFNLTIIPLALRRIWELKQLT